MTRVHPPTKGQAIIRAALDPDGGDLYISHSGDHRAVDLIKAIDAAIGEAFRLGFEHAVSGGDDAASKMPQLARSMPLVLYFANDADRREMIDAVQAAKPGMVEARIPGRTP